MSEQNYMLRRSKNWCVNRSCQQYIKVGMGGYLGDRADTVKHYKKSEQKWNKELKSLKKQCKSYIQNCQEVRLEQRIEE